ncbi:MAG: hypothetical protein J6K13_01225 [Clostridia bacterium]|nr:hypothetical protein [Clostridia bacterium]
MTKLIAMIVAILLLFFAVTVPAAPVATEPEVTVEEEIVEMTGTVVEMTDTYILIENADGQQVQVNFYADTVFEGDAPTPGALIHILYNGMMTRSLPPQINALRVGCYTVTGSIVELTETGFTLDRGDEIIEVHAAGDLLAGLETGTAVTVYFNGAMTMSLPAQIGAELIVPAAQ